MRQRALEAEVPLTDYARSAVLGLKLRRVSIPLLHLEAVGEMKRVGNNLNQIAVAIHSNRAPLGWLRTTRELRDWLARVEAQLLGVAHQDGDS